MDAFNNGTFVGRLTADPTVGIAKNDTKYANFTLARDRAGTRGENKKTDFIRFSAFGASADIVEKYAHKGDMLGVNYSLRSESVEVTEGTRQTMFNFVVNNVGLLGSNGKNNMSDNNQTTEFTPDSQDGASSEELPW